MQTLEATETKLERKSAHSPVITELSVSGMSCGNCARHVTEAIQRVTGVQSAVVSLESQSAKVRWAPEARADVEALIQAVTAEGYEARSLDLSCPPHHGEKKLAGWQLNVLVGVPITVALMLGEWALGLGTIPWFQWLSFALATIVQVVGGGRFYKGTWAQLKVGNSNMDTLVALGSSTAFTYSVWALLSGQGGHLYFMEAAAIISLISLGHWTESRVGLRASSALRDLLNLAPTLACRRAPDGREVQVPIAELVVGDLVVLRPGDRVPTDGQVAEGQSAVDESMLTGESAPIDKAPGTQLYAGTVNLNGRLLMRVTAVGEDTALAHVIAAVQRAQTSRATIQRLGDRVSSVFVPIVVTIALAAGLWWGLAPESAMRVHDWMAQFTWMTHPPQGAVAAGFIIAAAVLIVACPCAMGLATPAAIMAGSNAAARRGILIRDGVALEKAGSITAVIFDKTGTLTVGKPSVAKVWVKHEPGDRVLALAASLARQSRHPISQAVASLSGTSIHFGQWQEVHGAGVEAWVSGEGLGDAPQTGRALRACLGSLGWLRGQNVDFGPVEEFIQEWSAQGATLVAVAVEQSVLAVFAVRDTIKEGAREVIRKLHEQNLETYLVTGDNRITAEAIAARAGIGAEHVFAEVRPEKKAEFIKRLQQGGQRVAFVGDGINDAPALEQADLGIAVSRASDIAREAADIILLKSEIQAVPESLGLARATLRTIKQNLFWAFFYNAAGIPLAALGLMSPILCAAAMGLSDIVVIGNALRLLRWRL